MNDSIYSSLRTEVSRYTKEASDKDKTKKKEKKKTKHKKKQKKNEEEEGYRMGVYICLGQPIFQVEPSDAIPMSKLGSFQAIHDYVEKNEKILVFMGEGLHKIKRKAEQTACKRSIDYLE